MRKTPLLLTVLAIPLGILFRLSVVLSLTTVILWKLTVRRTQRILRQRRRSHG